MNPSETRSPPNLTVVVSAPAGAFSPEQKPKTDVNDLPQPIKKMVGAEKKIWEHIVKSLAEYGLVHRTDAATLHVIANTFARWVEAEEALDKLVKEKGTYFVQTPNGYEQPHQKYYVSRNLKKELLQWLPEACLTIPSFQKVQRMAAGEGAQGNLFDDPLVSHIAGKPRLVHG